MFLQLLHLNLTPKRLASTLEGVSNSTLERTLSKCAEVVHKPLCDAFIIPVPKEVQSKKGIEFKEFPNVALIVDCSIQPRAR